MKYIFTFLTFTLFAGLISCSKSDNKTTSSNRWILNDKAYNATTVQIQKTEPYAFSAYDNLTGSDVYIFFKKLPTASGTYKIRDVADEDDEVHIVAREVSGTQTTTYRSSGFDNIIANVVIEGESISITIPNVWLSTLTTGGADVRFSATLSLL